jgi:hypothetical protein
VLVVTQPPVQWVMALFLGGWGRGGGMQLGHKADLKLRNLEFYLRSPPAFMVRTGTVLTFTPYFV